MTPSEIVATGRKKAILATLTGIGFYLLVLLLKETHGDFANGLLFFLSDVLSISFLIVMGILFFTTYLLGGRMGKAIITQEKKIPGIALLNALIITIVLISFPLIISLLNGTFRTNNFAQRVLISTFVVFVSLFLVWLWTGYRIQSARGD